MPLRVVHRPPPEIPIRPGVVYFMLEVQSDHWKPVLEERTISIYLPAPFDPTRMKLELAGIPRPTSGAERRRCAGLFLRRFPEGHTEYSSSLAGGGTGPEAPRGPGPVS